MSVSSNAPPSVQHTIVNGESYACIDKHYIDDSNNERYACIDKHPLDDSNNKADESFLSNAQSPMTEDVYVNILDSTTRKPMCPIPNGEDYSIYSLAGEIEDDSIMVENELYGT